MAAKGGIQKRAIPKLLGAWTDKNLASCFFTTTQIRGFSLPELVDCPWYIECRRTYAPAEEEHAKKEATALKVVVEDLSAEEEEEEVAKPSPEKKKKRIQKKQQPEKKIVKATKSSSVRQGVASSARSDGPASGSQGAVVVSPVPPEFFVPSQWQTATSLRSETVGSNVTKLILQYSIRDAIEYMVKTKTQSQQQVQILDFAKKVGTLFNLLFHFLLLSSYIKLFFVSNLLC